MWLVEFWKFIFSSVWTWLGTVILFSVMFSRNGLVTIIRKSGDRL